MASVSVRVVRGGCWRDRAESPRARRSAERRRGVAPAVLARTLANQVLRNTKADVSHEVWL